MSSAANERAEFLGDEINIVVYSIGNFQMMVERALEGRALFFKDATPFAKLTGSRP